MKISVALVMTLACAVGLAVANYGYYPTGQGASYGGNGGNPHETALVMTLVCAVGLAAAQYGYYPPGKASAGGSGGFLALLGLLFVVCFLFRGTSTTSGTNTNTINWVNATG